LLVVSRKINIIPNPTTNNQLLTTNSCFMKESLVNKLETLSERQQELHGLLSDPGIIGNQTRFREYSKEASDITPVVECFRRYRKNLQVMESAREMLHEGDRELRDLAMEEMHHGTGTQGVIITP